MNRPHAAQAPILIVEDNPMDLDLTLRAFSRASLSNPIQVARDGQEALDHLAQWEQGAPLPVVILLDLKLPKVDGLEVLRQIKTHPHFSMIPVIVLTTSAGEADIFSAYGAGANSYILKPVDFDRFLDMAAQIQRYWIVLNQQAG